MEKTLILTAVHGDEGFSIPVIKSLNRQFSFDWTIANRTALAKQIRFIDVDLNRSGPGNPGSPLLEQRLAYKLVAKARGFDQTIDIHGTNSESGIFIIVTNPDWSNIELAKKFDLENVVLWPGFKPTGPLSQFIPNSLEIECGPKQNPRTAVQLERIMRRFLDRIPRSVEQNYFLVTDRFGKTTCPGLLDFKPVKNGKQTFYPLFTGQYPGIGCYMMQKINPYRI